MFKSITEACLCFRLKLIAGIPELALCKLGWMTLGMSTRA